jgi:hypothetical protein
MCLYPALDEPSIFVFLFSQRVLSCIACIRRYCEGGDVVGYAGHNQGVPVGEPERGGGCAG